MNITFIASPNFTYKRKRVIKYIIIHYTGMKSSKDSLLRLKNPKHKVSCHYFLDYDGSITQMIKDQNISWHAGLSYWDGIKNLNSNSIGIELQNKGEEFGYEKFGKKQISSLIKLIHNLKIQYNVQDPFILGHSDIAPDRKIDPGYLFPWDKLFKAGIGLLPKEILSNQELLISKIKDLQKLLKEFGYQLEMSTILDQQTLQVIYAFQSHYCPKELKGFVLKSKLIPYLKSLIKTKNRILTNNI